MSLSTMGPDSSALTCPNGHQVTEGHCFCTECGTAIDRPVEPEASLLSGPIPAFEDGEDDVADSDGTATVELPGEAIPSSTAELIPFPAPDARGGEHPALWAPADRAPETAASIDEAEPASEAPSRRRWPWSRRAIAAAVVMAFAAAALTAGINYSSAQSWRHRDRLSEAHAADLTSRLSADDKRVADLQSQLSGLNQQLAEVANEKAKAQDTSAALSKLLSTAGSVASSLESCVQATNSFTTALIGASDFASVEALTPEADQVDQLCSNAENANRALQAAIASVG